MPDQGIDVVSLWISKLRWLTTKVKNLKDRITVLDELTCSHENRLEQLEEWQDKIDDRLEAE